MQDAIKPAQDNLKAWADLAQNQAREAQAALTDTVEAIKGIKIDKVTVWDGGKGSKDGKTATAGFLSGLASSIPPLEDLFKMAGMSLPDYLKGRAEEGCESDSDARTEAPSKDAAESPQVKSKPYKKE